MNQIETSEPKVLGIALVVEELGKGSRLIFRYPSASSSDTNIFFTLSPRVFAKLFHTKLCGQPVTLLVDGTMICCRSVMLHTSNGSTATTSSSTSTAQSDETSAPLTKSNPANITSSPVSQGSPIAESPSFNDTSKQMDELYTSGLAMFSIVVALLPVQRQTRTRSYNASNPTYETQDVGDKVSVAYPIIRKIHLSLARVCAVLEREERRCMYMSRQVAMCIKIGCLDIGNDDDQRKQESFKETVGGSPKQQPFMKHQGHGSSSTKIENEIHERMESILTAKPPPSIELDDNNLSESKSVSQVVLRKLMIPLHGNLAWELTQIYHSLARNNSKFCNPTYLLSNREGIVYINNHIAVNIDAAVEDENTPFYDNARDNIPLLRPYHTILFPRVSAKDLLHNINASFSQNSIDDPNQMNGSDLSQRRLEKLLSVCDPSKSLHDMASETALPLSIIIDVALRLVETGVCIAVPQLQSSVKFACQHDSIQKISSLRLQFAQEFFQVPIFVVISALTVKPNYICTFGEILRYCKETVILESRREEESEVDDVQIDEYNMVIPMECTLLTKSILNSIEVTSIFDEDDVTELMVAQHVESVIRKMTTWLRSRAVIVELKDYLVSPNVDQTVETVVKVEESSAGIKKSNSAGDIQYLWGDSDGEALFHECKKNDYFSGKISTGALAWRIGKRQMELVRDYGIREQKLQVVTRIPCAGEDDWGAP